MDPGGGPRLLVVGAGAVGSLLGAAAARGGLPVALVRRSAPRAGRAELVVREHGRAPVAVPVEVVPAPAAAEPPDIVLLAVRQFDLTRAVESLAGFPHAAVATAENGVGAEEAVLAARPAASLVAVSVTASVAVAPDGALEWLRRGGVGLAPVRGDAALARRLAAALDRGGLPARVFDDWSAMKWSKLVANLVGNATSALLDLDPEAVYADPRLYAIERAQLREALAVMRARGTRAVDLPGAPVAWLARAASLPAPLGRLVLRRVVGGARGGKAPSLRAAVAAGGATEVAWLNGAVARAAGELGLAAPVNARLAELVAEAAADPARRAWYVGRPERLAAALAAAS